MGASRKLDLERRLEAYFTTLRPATLKDTLKRSAGNWQIYAAVTGSAMAMVTSASAAIIGTGVDDISSNPTGSARTNKEHLQAFTNAVKFAMAKQDAGAKFLLRAGAKASPAAQSGAPS